MAKTVALTDEQHGELVQLAKACGFEVKRGPRSEIGKFVIYAAQTAAALHRAKLVNPGGPQRRGDMARVAAESEAQS